MSRVYRVAPTDPTINDTITLPHYTEQSDHGLLFVGPGVTPYGQQLNQNILSLVETFARPEDGSGDPDPEIPNPLTGQLWYNTTTEKLLVYNGSSWEDISNDVSADPGTYVANNATQEIRISRNGGSEPDVVITGVATIDDLNTHVAISAAHDAATIVFDSTASIPATNVELALESVRNQTQSHINDTTAAHAASVIGFVPFGSLGSTVLQDAISELEVEVDVSATSAVTNANSAALDHINDTSAAHDSDEISFSPPATLTSTDVRSAIDEIESKLVASSGSLDSLRARRVGAATFSASAPSKVFFNSVEFGNTEAQFSIVTSTYTAAFDHIVMVNYSFASGGSGVGNSDDLRIFIYKNGSPVAETLRRNSSSGNVNLVVRTETKLSMLTGDTIEFYAFSDASPPFTIPINTDPDLTYIEFTVVKLL